MPSLWRQLIPSPIARQGMILILFLCLLLGGQLFLIPVAWAPAWQEGGVAYVLLSGVLEPTDIISHTAVYMGLVGIFIGLAGLWIVDRFRRYPGFVLWTGIIAGSLLFWREWSDPLSSGIIAGSIFFIVGIIFGLQIGGLPVIQYIRGNKTGLLPRRTKRRFNNSVRFVLVSLVLLGLIGVIDHHIVTQSGKVGIRNTDVLAPHLGALVSVIIPVAAVLKYGDIERIIQLGPARSGKTSTQGGLYAGVEQTDRRSELLNRIYNEYMRHGRFPDRTNIYELADKSSIIQLDPEDDDQNGNENALVIEFSYITGDPFLPKEKVLTSVDYPGEILTGTADRNIAVSDYVENMKENGTGSWSEAMGNLREGENKLVEDNMDIRQLKSNVAMLIHNADVIMFTIPLDDFVAPILKHRPTNVPEYHSSKLWIIKKLENEPEKYKVKKLSDDESEWVKLFEQNGILQPEGNQRLAGFVAEKEKWRGGNGFYFYREDRDRVHPEEYMWEYKDIIDGLPDLRNHSFIWAATMTDLIFQDFENIANKGRGPRITSSQEETVTLNQQTENIEIGRSDIDIDLIRNLFERHKPSQSGPLQKWNPEYYTDEYKLLSEWITQEYLLTEESELENWVDQTRENYIFPIWFKIDGNSENSFSNNPPVLHGAKYIRARLRGEKLKPKYPGGLKKVLQYKSPLNNNEAPLPQSAMAYQVLRSLKQKEQYDTDGTTAEEEKS